jgi:hypothetical protein
MSTKWGSGYIVLVDVIIGESYLSVLAESRAAWQTYHQGWSWGETGPSLSSSVEDVDKAGFGLHFFSLFWSFFWLPAFPLPLESATDQLVHPAGLIGLPCFFASFLALSTENQLLGLMRSSLAYPAPWLGP